MHERFVVDVVLSLDAEGDSSCPSSVFCNSLMLEMFSDSLTPLKLRDLLTGQCRRQIRWLQQGCLHRHVVMLAVLQMFNITEHLLKWILKVPFDREMVLFSVLTADCFEDTICDQEKFTKDSLLEKFQNINAFYNRLNHVNRLTKGNLLSIQSKLLSIVNKLLQIQLFVKNVTIWSEVIQSNNRDAGLSTIACDTIALVESVSQANCHMWETWLTKLSNDTSVDVVFEPTETSNFQCLLSYVDTIVVGLEAAILRLEVLYPGDQERFDGDCCVHINSDLLIECVTRLSPIVNHAMGAADSLRILYDSKPETDDQAMLWFLSLSQSSANHPTATSISDSLEVMQQVSKAYQVEWCKAMNSSSVTKGFQMKQYNHVNSVLPLLC
jgi:hypothetical protein